MYTEVQPGCFYWSIPGVACIKSSGTINNPIIMQAAPGHEGNVIIDGSNANMAISVKDNDYIIIRGFEIRNTKVDGIVTKSTSAITNVVDDSLFSVGVEISNNYIHDITSINSGSNLGAIMANNAKDWVIKNNKMHTICGMESEGGCRYVNAACVYSYYIWNATVENNECYDSMSGVHWKDHVLDEYGSPTIWGSTVRYNLFYDAISGFYISHGNRDPQSSNHTVTNNIFHDLSGSCMNLNTDTANGAQSINYVFNHNICDNALIGIFSTSAQVTSSYGNIFSDVVFNSKWADIYKFSNDANAQLEYSDYNFFEPNFSRSLMDNPIGNSSNIFSDLNSWRAATSSSVLTLNDDNPDINSLEVSESELFFDSSNQDYNLPVGSPAIGFMPDGSNAGAYQDGNEIIGLLPNHFSNSETSSEFNCNDLYTSDSNIFFCDGFESGDLSTTNSAAFSWS